MRNVQQRHPAGGRYKNQSSYLARRDNSAFAESRAKLSGMDRFLKRGMVRVDTANDVQIAMNSRLLPP